MTRRATPSVPAPHQGLSQRNPEGSDGADVLLAGGVGAAVGSQLRQ